MPRWFFGSILQSIPRLECDKCGLPTVPYDGCSRFFLTTHEGPLTYQNLKSTLYQFLMSEMVPDPDSGKSVPILAAMKE